MTVLRRLVDAWRALLTGPPEKPCQEDDDVAVALRRDLAEAQLQLQEARDSLAVERKRLAAVEQAKASEVADGVAAQMEALLERLAAPLSQLRMQDALLEAGTDVAARDVMALVRTLARVVEDAGLEPIGEAGSVMPFDPDVAQPLGAAGDLAAGDEVQIKFIGYRYQGKVIRKALVERSA